MTLRHSIRYISPNSLVFPSSITEVPTELSVVTSDAPPKGMVKSILPCTQLAVVKCLEHLGVYNKILPYGDRAFGRVVTVINR